MAYFSKEHIFFLYRLREKRLDFMESFTRCFAGLDRNHFAPRVFYHDSPITCLPLSNTCYGLLYIKCFSLIYKKVFRDHVSLSQKTFFSKNARQSFTRLPLRVFSLLGRSPYGHFFFFSSRFPSPRMACSGQTNTHK